MAVYLATLCLGFGIPYIALFLSIHALKINIHQAFRPPYNTFLRYLLMLYFGHIVTLKMLNEYSKQKYSSKSSTNLYLNLDFHHFSSIKSAGTLTPFLTILNMLSLAFKMRANDL